MSQGDFFNDNNDLIISGEEGIVEYIPNFLTKVEADIFFEKINSETPWVRPIIKMFSKSFPVPRDTAWYGEKAYIYSGIRNNPLEMTETLKELRKITEKKCLYNFNSLLINRYLEGKDKVGWHSDDESELKHCKIIASVSLGEGRDFRIRKKEGFQKPEDDTKKIFLEHGSLLIMRSPLQSFWEHEVPKRSTENCRINLTFRNVD